MLDRAILSLESVVLSPSSNSAIGSSRIWDRKFASPCVESFFFDSCIVSSPPLTVDFLFVLFGPILCLICSIVISPHCLHILIGSLFNFSWSSILKKSITGCSDTIQVSLYVGSSLLLRRIFSSQGSESTLCYLLQFFTVGLWTCKSICSGMNSILVLNTIIFSCFDLIKSLFCFCELCLGVIFQS